MRVLLAKQTRQHKKASFFMDDVLTSRFSRALVYDSREIVSIANLFLMSLSNSSLDKEQVLDTNEASVSMTFKSSIGTQAVRILTCSY